MSNGWIKLHRKIFEWEWFHDHITFKVFIYLIIMANHKDTKWHGIELKRGQLITGRKKISEDLFISEQNTRTSLTRLKSTNELTIKTTNKFSIITICNYESYQKPDSETNQLTNQQANQQLTNNQPTTNHIQELKNKKKKEKEMPTEHSRTPLKIKYKDFVFLTKEEHQTLVNKFGASNANEKIERLNDYIGSKGVKYKSHYFTILSWDRKNNGNNGSSPTNKLDYAPRTLPMKD